MSYQVLARKWRPGKFGELVGQEHVVSAISNALDNDRLHHAYLFTGTRGVGKTTIARIFSKSLNCEEGQGANPCGQCHTCKEIEQGNYVDLLEIDAASRTKVEDTRELLDNVQYKPTRGRYKVYLIDEVHMLSKHSFNALLKTLEEPPPHVKFLLATTDPQKLPITILSRCLQFNLKAMSREQIVGQLTHILEQEQLSFEPQALSLLARAAQGSMRDALSLTDQAIAQGGNQVTASVVTDMLGLMDKNQLLKIINAVVNKTPNDVIQLVNDLAEQAPDYDNVHGELASLLHQIALTQWVPEACKLETTSAKAIYQLAKTIPAEQVQLLYQIAIQGRKDLPFAADGKSAFEMTLMRMMSFAPATPPDNGADNIERGGSEHDLPVKTGPQSQTGDPGNVGKQEEALKSETLADDTQQAEAAKPQFQGQPTFDITSESDVQPEPDIQPEPELSEASHSAYRGGDMDTVESEPSAGQEPLANKQPSENTVPEPSADAMNVANHANTANFDSDPQLGESQHSESQHSESQKAELQKAESQHSGSLKAESQRQVTEQPEPEQPQQLEPQQVDASSEASHPQSGLSPFSDNEPPLDAYLDDMPPASDEEYPPDISSGFSHHADSEQNGSQDIAPETAQPSPEEQLSATASMLALRQKMKQRKAQDTEDKKAQVSAESPSQDAADRMSNTLRSRFSNANATPSAQDNQAQPSQQHIEQEQSDPNQSQLQSQMSEAEGSANKVVPVLSDSVNTASDNTSSPITADFQPSVNSDESGQGSAFDDDEFFDAEFEEDMPFASDSQPDSPDSQSALSNQGSLQQDSLQEASSQKNANESFFTEDHPPWDTAQSNGSVDLNDTVTFNDTAARDSLHNTNAEQVPFQSANQSTESKQSSYDQGASFQSNVDYSSSTAEQSDGSGVITSTPSGSLSAYLEDGTKLTHASQIDEWSNLVEQMPIAGLLKQLFLHASFSRDNGTVSLEIDNSQSHLLNESAKQQLLDTLHHGLGENVTVNITLGKPNSTPFALQQDIHAMRQAHAHSVVQTDEKIQALLSIFDASVLTDSVKAR